MSMVKADHSDMNQDAGYIKGEILYTIFRNEQEQFAIAKIKILETNEHYTEKEIVGKGYVSHLQTGTPYIFYGHLENHPKFGLQYAISSYQTYIPTTKEGLIQYLSSDLFYGIGKKTAKRIVDTLGESAIQTILDDPQVIKKIPGLKQDVGENLVKVLQENQGFEQVVVAMAKYGVGLKMSQKIYSKYKEEALHVLKQDPYQFVFDIEGFGFQTADQIAMMEGLSETHGSRIRAGCVYVCQQSIQDGHVYLPIQEVVDRALELLHSQDIHEPDILDALQQLDMEKKLIIQEDKVYLPILYYAEDGFASHLKRLLDEPVPYDTTLADLMAIIGAIEEEESISYGQEQFDAIQLALQSKVMILTGGPGTGKTTVIKGIIKAFAAIHHLSTNIQEYEYQDEFPFILTAPTGRAAKRLNESTGMPATTIHRLLGWNGQDSFEKDEHERLKGKFLIVDEFSMVDIWLANHLFKAIPDDMQVLLVGDEDQLPSVGPGQVLSDLISMGLIPMLSLTEVYRQKEGSKIIQLAHHIRNDICTIDDLANDRDFSFIPCREHQVIDVITQIFQRAHAKGIDMKEIQVLAPMYKTRAGITEINKRLQEIVNPYSRQKRQKRFHDVVYRVGDKVIQLVNQPEDGVSNGDIGEIVAIFEEQENTDQQEQIVVLFDEKEVVYERKDYSHFMHAYCISIHKSQGSEFPIVILPVVSSYRRMLRKNLLYTAITRSKKTLIICGEKDAFIKGIETLDTNQRYTSLKETLLERMSHITDSEAEDGLTPYDFM